MKIKVIIPVCRPDLAQMLLGSIEQNTRRPDDVLVIDNTSEGEPMRFRSVVTMLYRSGAPLGVNASWNTGISLAGDCDVLSILNDDIVLGTQFFERIDRVFKGRPECVAVCPHTVFTLDGLYKYHGSGLVRMERREGWAFSFRKELLDKVPPIPADRIRTFCGDDWLWHWTRKLGYFWYKDLGNVVYHKVGGSMTRPVRRTLREEKRVFAELIREAA